MKVYQRLVRQQAPVWPRAEPDTDLPLDAVHQVGLQDLDAGLGSQIGASLTTRLGDRFSHADLAEQLARGVHHIGNCEARNLGDAHAAVVAQHEHKNIEFRVAGRALGDLDEASKLPLVKGVGA